MDFLTVAPLIDFGAILLGSLFALLLLGARRGNHNANRWLAACSASLALLSSGDLLEDTRWAIVYPALAHTTDWLIFVIGPCVWLYVRRLTLDPVPHGARAAFHFVPAILCLLLLVPFHLVPLAEQRTLLTVELTDGTRDFDPVIAVAVLHILAYWIASLGVLQRYARRLKNEYSSIEKRRFRWLAWVLLVGMAMWTFWLLGLASRGAWAQWLGLMAVPVGLYVLAFAGLRQPAVFATTTERSVARISGAAPASGDVVGSSPPAFASAPLPAPLEASGPSATGRYARSGLDQPRAAELRTRLEQLMDLEKPWLENDLTLTELAARLGASSHHLSQLLNEELGQTFFDYINRRRVTEVQRCLTDSAYASQTLLDVALAAGFNSKAAFNTAFKKHTRLTPSQFRLRSSAQQAERA